MQSSGMSETTLPDQKPRIKATLRIPPPGAEPHPFTVSPVVVKPVIAPLAIKAEPAPFKLPHTSELTPENYAELRAARGNQRDIAELLGVTQTTLSRRETGATPVSVEAYIAMRSLPVLPADSDKLPLYRRPNPAFPVAVVGGSAMHDRVVSSAVASTLVSTPQVVIVDDSPKSPAAPLDVLENILPPS